MNRKTTTRSFRAWALAGVAAAAIAAPAYAEQARRFDIPQQNLVAALEAFGKQGDKEILFSRAQTQGRAAPGLSGDYEPAQALSLLLEGSGLRFRQVNPNTYVVEAADPQGGSAGNAVQALIVTAQKREEDIQDVPIAISAFSQEDLTRSQVAGGPDLMTQVPNMTFTKTNFSSYSIQIRGIGTQAISATTDPAVAVAFNNTPFIQNRFFEQEFYDLERVEVLRGPQGTLYGRNATAGVVNIISAKPKFYHEAKGAVDVANYGSTRVEGMVNVPLIEDALALRLAGAWTKRDGYVTNEITGNPIDGRDLWSTRLSLRFEPNDRISANLIWEHFEEDDDRLRSGKQLCKKDPSKTEIAGVPMPVEQFPGTNTSPLATYNQGCLPSSLYSPDSFQTPNGFALPYYHPLSDIGLPTVQKLDPYVSTVQSRDLRVIESTVDPSYRSRSDVAELQLSFDIGDYLTLASETAYSANELFSTQDFNRFNTAPGAFDQAEWDSNPPQRANLLVDGVFCDPQIGCADRLVAVDLSTADSRQFAQEFRLSSDYDGPFNFSLGANFLRFDAVDKYYVFINTLSLFVARNRVVGGPVLAGDAPYEPGVTDNYECLPYLQSDPNLSHSVQGCIYMDPNPIDSLNDRGHNYFLSINPYRLISYAAFGEAYYNLADNLKVTAGLRWTVDKKHAPQIPSWLLAGAAEHGSVGYPVKDIIDSEWREPTGRLTIDWKPELSFTDETLLYASYAHGYKAGGANPPPMVVVLAGTGQREGFVDSVLHPPTFDPEFIDAFELGAKNTFLDGRLTLNTAAFYYDYEGYQISQIIDRTAINSNFDAQVWGLEMEADWRPMENLRFGLKLGYEDTKVADGEKAVDVMNRLNGHEDEWIVAKPFPSLPSNCVLPLSVVTFGDRINTKDDPGTGVFIGYCAQAYIEGTDPVTGLPYVPNPTQRESLNGNISALHPMWNGYPGFDPSTAPNNGAGFDTDLSGNELPNAPNFTASLRADYTIPLKDDWLMTLHTDLYYQSEAWTRIFNLEGYDKLKAYTNVNLAAIFTNEERGWNVMAYVKNVMDRDSITGAFLNSDDTGLTTNVFLTEPRLYGVRVTKAWNGGPVLGSWPGRRSDRPLGEPYPFTFEFGGGVARLQPDTEAISPTWLDIYLPSGGFPLDPQDHELDWGDQRSVKLVYAFGPRAAWRAWAGYRWGEANGFDFGEDKENLRSCGTVSPFLPLELCNDPLSWGTGYVNDREEYGVADFMVGRDVGIGAWGEGGSSVVAAGVRYANLTSDSMIEHRGWPDHYYPSGFVFTTHVKHWHDYFDKISAKRTFKGTGPMLSWEAASPLIGGRDTGHVALDWSVGGGVLFGKQKINLHEVSEETYRVESLFSKTKTITETPRTREESRSIQVPTVSASIGLSYKVDWMQVGAGYRWERYFDAIDGGAFDERRDVDRDIHGPYLKMSIGFGG